MAQDPQWAVRWVKRAVKAFAAVWALITVLWIGWLLLPEAPAVTELSLHTNADAFLGDTALG
jgi:hypothetical protein